MANLTLTPTDIDTILDESTGLQNLGLTGAEAQDLNDNDFDVSILTSAISSAFDSAFEDTLWRTDSESFANMVGIALTGYNGSNSGLDAFTVSGDGTVSVALTDAAGGPLAGLDSELLTLKDSDDSDGGGNHIFLYSFSDSLVLGREGTGGTDTPVANPAGDIIFAIHLDETATGGKFWTVLLEPLQHGVTGNTVAAYDDSVDLTDKLFVSATQDLTFNLDNAPSGQLLFLMVGDGDITGAGEAGFVVTGKNPLNESESSDSITSGDTVNSSQATTGATLGSGNQMVSSGTALGQEGQGLFFTYVTDPDPLYTVPNLTHGEAVQESNILYGGLLDSTEATFEIVQLQGGKQAVVTVSASIADIADMGDAYVEGLADHYEAGHKIAITAIDVFDEDSGGEIEKRDNGDGTWTIFGVEAGDTIKYTTEDPHNRVLIENDGALMLDPLNNDAKGKLKPGAEFDVGGFKLLEVTGETIEVGSQVLFEDDGPGGDPSDSEEPTLTTDDTDTGIPSSASTNFAGQVLPAFGIDGGDIADSVEYHLSVSAPGATSGLKDTLTNQDVLLNKVGNDIVGTVSDGGSGTYEVLRISVVETGATGGTVTLVQSRSVVHDDPDDHDETGESAAKFSSADLVVLSATVTDNDGDTATIPLDIGFSFRFEDDGPDVALSLGDGFLETSDGDLAGGNEGDRTGTDSHTQVLGTLFTVDTELVGADTDGTESTVYALELDTDITTGLVDTVTNEAVQLVDNLGVIEGRTETSDDLVFTLSIVSSTGAVTQTQHRAVVHSTPDTSPNYNGDSTGLGTSGPIYVSATLTDKDGDSDKSQVDISAKLNFKDDGPDVALSLGDGFLETSDGDLAGGNEGDRTGTDSHTQVLGTLFTVDTELVGADTDGTESTVYALELDTDITTGLVDTVTNEAVQLVDNLGVIEGRTETSDDLVFTLSIVSSTGAVTQTQHRAVVHSTPDTSPNYNGDSTGLGTSGPIYVSATLTDKDGDSDKSQVDISAKLNFKDDGPDVALSLGDGFLETSDGDLAGGNEGDRTGTDSHTQVLGTLFTVDTELVGADTDGTESTVYALELDTDITTGLVDTVTNEAVQLVDNLGVIEGRTETSDDLVFTLSIVSSTGAVTQTQHRAVVHSTPDTSPNYNGDSTGLGTSGPIYVSATLTDKDGDSDKSQVDISAKLNFKDDGPDVALSLGDGFLETSDGDLAGGNEGDRTGTDSHTQVLGTLFTVDTELVGADTDGTESTVYALELDTDITTGLVDTVTNEAVQLVDNLGVIEGRTETSDDLVFTLSIVSSTGAVTQTQHRAVVHSTPDTSPNYNGDSTGLGTSGPIYVSATLTDKDGDSDKSQVDISTKLNFKDDGPDVALSLGDGFLETSDGDLAGGNEGDRTGTDSHTQVLGTLFTVDTELVGADTDGTESTVYALELDTDITTGLVDTVTNEAVQLVDNLGVIEGRTETSDDLVFTLSIVSSTGAVTQTQHRAVVHSTPDTSPNYNGDSTGLGTSGPIYVSATLTDKDGDSDKSQVDISAKLNFKDDGPDVALSLGDGFLETSDGDLAGGNEGDRTGTDSHTQVLGTLFTVDTELVGADTDGTESTVYALELDTDITTGLVDTVTNEAVQLVDNLGVIEGRTETSDDLVFTLSIVSSTGAVTQTQHRAVVHSTPDTSPNYNGDSTGLGTSGPIYVSATLTDKDGDSDKSQVDISAKLNFKDDGPDVALSLGDGFLETSDGDLAGGNEGDRTGTDSHTQVLGTLFTVDTELVGADTDGTESTVYALELDTDITTGLVDTVTNEAVQLVDNLGVIEGRTETSDDLVFTLSIVSSTGAVTQTQHRAVVHSTPDTSPNYNGDSTGLGTSGPIYVSATLTDKDGDSDKSQVDISAKLNFKDDGPDVALSLGDGFLETSDGDLAGGNEGDRTGTDSHTQVLGTLFTVDTELVGADTDGTESTVYALELDTDITTGLVDTVTNEAVQLVDNLGVIEGRTETSDDLVFTLSIVSSTGAVTQTQHRAVVHSTPDTSPNYNGDSTGLGTSGPIYVSATLTDKDGDSDKSQVDISAKLNFKDDGPDVALSLGDGFLETSDGDLAGGNEGDRTGTDSHTQVLGTLFTVDTELVGADTDGTESTVYALELDTDITTGLVDTVTNEAVQLVDNLGVIEGRTETSDDLVFTLSIVSSTGAVTQTQHRAVVHSTPDTSPNYNGDSTGLGTSGPIYVSATLTDKDGDSDKSQVDISAKLNFKDDGPALEFGNLVGTGTENPQIGFWSESVGADKPGNLAITTDGTFDIRGPDGSLMVDAGAISNFVFNEASNTWDGTLTADFDGNLATADTSVDFTLTTKSDGSYVFDLEEGFGSTTTFSTEGGQLPAGGPDPVQTLVAIGDVDIVFFAVDPRTALQSGTPTDIEPAVLFGAPDLTEEQLQAMSSMSDIGSGLDPADYPDGVPTGSGDGTFGFINDLFEMNVSGTGIGVGNNVLQGNGNTYIDLSTSGPDAGKDESFVVNPELLLTNVEVFVSKTAGDFAPPGRGATPAKTDYLYYNVIDANGVNSGPVLVEFADVTDNGDSWSFDIDWNGTSLIDAVQLTMAFGDIKIPEIQFTSGSTQLASDIFLDFTAILTDGDGDSASSSFAIDLYADDPDAATADYTLVDAGTNGDAFNVDLSQPVSSYLIETSSFIQGEDQVVLLNPTVAYSLSSNVITANGTEITVEGVVLLTDADVQLVVNDQIIDGEFNFGTDFRSEANDAWINTSNANMTDTGTGFDTLIITDTTRLVTVTGFQTGEDGIVVYATAGSDFADAVAAGDLEAGELSGFLEVTGSVAGFVYDDSVLSYWDGDATLSAIADIGAGLTESDIDIIV